MKRSLLVLSLSIAALLFWSRDSINHRTDIPPPVARPESGSGSAQNWEDSEPVPIAKVPDTEQRLPLMRPDGEWQRAVSEPEFADFKAWTAEYADGRRGETDGVVLAKKRRAALKDLISRDPQRALDLAVPKSVRRSLPAAVQAELETPVNGRGDLLVAAAVALPGREHEVPPISRQVNIDGQELEAFTYGNRASAMSRRDMAIHGIALDSQLALSEWPARRLEPLEVKEARAKLASPPLCPVSGSLLDENGDEIVLDWSLESAHWYCQAGHATQELLAAAAAEAALPPGVAASGIGGGGVEVPAAKSSYTEGTKKMLIIRVDFPDKQGQVVSDTTLTSLISNMANQWSDMSYGKTTWTLRGAGSDFTPTLRLPKNHSSYTGFGTMLAAARAAAEDAGFDYRDYQFDVVVTGDKPDVSFGGVAYVGGRGAWLANGSWNLGICSHEVGHNFGLNHSGFWDTTDGTAIGAGSNVEYGNPFDHMGGASSSTAAHFNARQKNYLDWIPDSAVKKVTANGTVSQRITAMDRENATGFRAIAVDRSGTSQDFWIEYRSAYSSNKWMKDGVVVNFGDVSINNSKPSLLDFTPSTSSKDDCPILIGRTFSALESGVHITPSGRGTGADGVPWMDVTVNRGPFTGNRKPAAALSYSPSLPAVNAAASFTATASDPDGDTPSYFWDWGDGTWTANNSPTASHDWDTAGIKTVRCTVSDMKGMAATAAVLVQVGTSSTFFISGYVRNAAGLPMEGVTVTSGGKNDATDSEGFFAVTGLRAGNHTVSATKTGYTINPSGFTNPVSVGPSKSNINFIAPLGSPVFSAIKPGLADAGSNTGAVPLALTDNDTAVTDITLTAVPSNTVTIPAANIAFGAGTPRTITVTAPSASSGVVDITITARDPEGSTSTYVWPVTVNASPVIAPALQITAQDTPVDIDLRTMTADDRTPSNAINFSADRSRNGTVKLQPDGYTARFTPAPGHNGAASFRFTAHDQSLSSRTLLLYDFEPDEGGDVITTGTVPDYSNFNRSGSLIIEGNGEYSGVADVPALLAPHSTTALNLTTNGTTGAAKLRRTFAASDLNWNDADWTFCAWVKRTTSDTEDFVFHLGDGDGHGANDELELYFASGSDQLKLEKYNAAGVQASIVHPGVPAGGWHYLSITCDRTAANTATLALYVDGFLADSVTGVAMAVNQTRSMVVGGHAETSNLDRWLDGRVDDVMIAGSVLGRTEIRQLATMGTAHFLGISDTGTVNITVNGANNAPVILPPSDTGLNADTASAPLPFTVTDAESEHRTLSVSAASSNPALIPLSGITISPAPPAWNSADIGTVAAAGNHLEDHGTFHISGAGAGIGGTGDEFRFVSQDVTGDGEFVCRVAELDVTHSSARAGLMLRDGTAASAPFVMVAISAANGIQFISRDTAGTTATSSMINFVAAPVWLRLVRTVGLVEGFYAPDTNGEPGTWSPAGSATGLTLPVSPRAGLTVTSNVDATRATAAFDNIGGLLPSGDERTVTLTPIPGQSGTARVTLTVSDGSFQSTGEFLAVVDINTPPTVTQAPSINIVSGETPAAFTISVGDLHTAAGAITVTASSTNSVLLPSRRIVISVTGSQRTVQVRPVRGETGNTVVTLTVNDGNGMTATTSFNVSASPGDPAQLISHGANWRFLDNGLSPAGWNTNAFNDSGWPMGPAQLGFGDGDEETLVNATASRKATYFRRSFRVPNPELYQWLQLRMIRDDGAVVYLNGQEIWRSNMPMGIITFSTDASAAVGGALEDAWYYYTVKRPPLLAGTNVLAVELHQKGDTSSDLSFDFEARGANPEPQEVIAPSSTWQYLDTGTDPGSAWTSAVFDDSTWGTGTGQFGYGDGDETTVINGGPDSSRHVTTWFRKKFDVFSSKDIIGIGLRVLRDDGIRVWLNGQPLYLNNLPATATSSTLATAAISNAAEAHWQTAWLSPALVVDGVNQLAVEIHQSSLTSSDISFDLQLLLYGADALPPLSSAVSGRTLTVSWPLWAQAWQVQSSSDLRTWTAQPGTPVAGPLGYSLTFTRPTAKRYFRLVLP